MPAKVIVDAQAIQDLMRSPGVRDYLLSVARPAVARSQEAAPKLTGEGAASIHAQARLRPKGYGVKISWERIFFYMYFAERGTKFREATPFLVPSLQ